jgi:hypothetical protein
MAVAVHGKDGNPVSAAYIDILGTNVGLALALFTSCYFAVKTHSHSHSITGSQYVPL